VRLQPSVLEELRKAAEVEGVALNQLIYGAVAEKSSALRTEKYFRERGRRADRAETLRILERAGQGNPPLEGDELPRSGGRSQAAKRRMREIRPSGYRTKGPLLNSGAALRRQPRPCVWMCGRPWNGSLYKIGSRVPPSGQRVGRPNPLSAAGRGVQAFYRHARRASGQQCPADGTLG